MNNILKKLKVAGSIVGLAGLAAGSYNFGKNEGREEIYNKPVMVSLARCDNGDIELIEFGGDNHNCYPTGGGAYIPLINPKGETNYVSHLSFYIPKAN
jgi:hypothetical protein